MMPAMRKSIVAIVAGGAALTLGGCVHVAAIAGIASLLSFAHSIPAAVLARIPRGLEVTGQTVKTLDAEAAKYGIDQEKVSQAVVKATKAYQVKLQARRAQAPARAAKPAVRAPQSNLDRVKAYRAKQAGPAVILPPEKPAEPPVAAPPAPIAAPPAGAVPAPVAAAPEPRKPVLKPLFDYLRGVIKRSRE